MKEFLLEEIRQSADADLLGVAPVAKLRALKAVDPELMPEAKSALVVVCSHSQTALNTNNTQIRQYDTLATYERVRLSSKKISRQLEKLGYKALALPSALPIDMSEAKMGMVGLVDIRAAAVAAGIAIYGKSGLVLVPNFKARIRLGVVLTDAEIVSSPMEGLETLCPKNCLACLKNCPAQALKGNGNIDKEACIKEALKYGLRGYLKFTAQFHSASAEERNQLIKSFEFRELWQNFMTGTYYYCWNCQIACPP